MSEISGEKFAEVIRFLNEAAAPEEIAPHLKAAAGSTGERQLAATLLARRAAAGGAFESVDQLQKAGLAVESLVEVAASVRKALAEAAKIEPERLNFTALLLQNPNYFGNLETSPFPPVKAIKGNTSFEEMKCVGLNPPFDRLEAVIQVKKTSGYGGAICSPGSFEYVRFYVDLDDNGTLEDVGVGAVRVHNISGPKPLCYAVYLDFKSIRKRCITENIVKVRAILSWNVPPPPNSPNFSPVWGNRLDAEVQIHPRSKFTFGDFLNDLVLEKVPIPDPIGPVIKTIDPASTLLPLASEPLSVAQRKAIYKRGDVPAHRFAYPEAAEILASAASGPSLFATGEKTALLNLGLELKEVDSVVGAILAPTDGNTSFEEMKCVGLRPNVDTLEAVLTVKKKAGYSGGLCGPGSNEYVAFWIDFLDGAGFQYMGTSSVVVHDLQQVPAQGLQYAVFLKTNLSNKLIQCQSGARVVRLRAILSWAVPPPANNPNWVPVWGNREECRVQLRPRPGVGHVPFIETVGDVNVPDINLATGRATGVMALANVSLNQSPFGGGIAITGRIGNPPNSFGGGAQPFKYRVEVAPDGTNDWQPLTNKVKVSTSLWINGVPQQCAPGDFTCETTLTPTDDGDGFGPGWYPYLEDLTPPQQRFLVLDELARWETTKSMEGRWKMRITAKDASTSPPTIFNGTQVIKIRVDNTPPEVALTVTGATFNGNPIPAVACGKFPVGAVISGTFSVHDPGTVSPAADFQHYNNTSFEILPAGPAHGAAPTTVPVVVTFPSVGTTGVNGTWELNTAGMDPCGYVLRMVGSDRTNVDSRGNHFLAVASIGFCLQTSGTQIAGAQLVKP